MTPRLDQIWVYLETSPLLGLVATLLAYLAALELHRRSRHHPLANPVLLAVAMLVALLGLSGIPYQRYFDGAQFVHFLLGPATVALAVPLHAQFRRIRRVWLPTLAALAAGSATAIVSAMAAARLSGATSPTVLSLAPKSVTTPIAMGIAERIGGIPSLTAVLVIVTGILGAIAARPLFDRLRIADPAARGLAIGVAAHGIGTARAFEMGEHTGAFAALAMGLNGLITALLLPAALPWLNAWLFP